MDQDNARMPENKPAADAKIYQWDAFRLWIDKDELSIEFGICDAETNEITTDLQISFSEKEAEMFFGKLIGAVVAYKEQFGGFTEFQLIERAEEADIEGGAE